MPNSGATQAASDYLPCPYTRSNCPLFNPTFTSDEVRRYTSPWPAAQAPSPPVGLPQHAQPVAGPSSIDLTVNRIADPQSCYERHLNFQALQQQQQQQSSLPSPPAIAVSPTMSSAGSPLQRSVEQDFEDLFSMPVPSGSLSDRTNTHALIDTKPNLAPMASTSSSSRKAQTAAATSTKAVQATPFISKLFHLLSQAEYSHVISWSPDGRSIVFQQNSDDLLAVLGRIFRHSNTHSLVRQLNIYNFQRLETVDLLALVDQPPFDRVGASEWTAFRHDDFFRGATDLKGLKPKTTSVSKAKRASNGTSGVSSGGGKKRRTSGSPDSWDEQ